MRVLFLTNVPSPYRVDFFNELGKKCDLTVLFETQSAKSRDSKWVAEEFKNFKGIFLKGIRCGEAEALCPGVVKYLNKKRFDHIIVGIYSSPTGMLAIETMKMKKIPFILSSDGGIVKEESDKKRKFKKHFIAAASMWLSTGTQTTEYFKYYGAKTEKIFVYPFTSVLEKDVLNLPVEKGEKVQLRKKLNITEQYVVLSVGQFIPRKGFDLLMNSCEGLSKNIGVYIVGGEPTEEYINLKEKLHLTNFHFVPFMEHDKLAEYYKSADLFVLPTREDIWGLVINEAMAYGLPVFTTDKCVAGVEMINGNGAVYPVDVNWKSAIEEWIEKCKGYGNKSIDIAHCYTIEKMASCHISILNGLDAK